jgi:hypothetical protein
MMYFERHTTHCLFWPVIAMSLDDEFWIGIGWLNLEVGWRDGDDGYGDKSGEAWWDGKLKEKNT